MLHQGKSKKAFSKNVETEMHAGKPQKQALAIAYAVKRKAQKKAYGGMIDHEEDEHMPEMHMEHPMEHEHTQAEMEMHEFPAEDEMPMHHEDEHEHDIVHRAMKHFSHGGMVANEGEDELDHLADGEPNEFDELAKDDHLEFAYTGSNSGDEIGDEREEHDREDIIKRAMHSLAKKDRLPRVR